MTMNADKPSPSIGGLADHGHAGHPVGVAGGAWYPLTIVLTALALAAALGGLLIDGAYTGAASAAAMFRGYDLVTALAVAPSLAVSSWLARRGSFWGQLMAVSLVVDLVYTYAYYLFGTGFNDLFLLHVAVFGAGLMALVLNFATIDPATVAVRFAPGTHVRSIAGILGMLAIGLAAMWVFFAIDNVITGEVPPGSQLVETDTIVRLAMALDLTVLVPLYAAAALLIWRRAGWGFVLAAIALFGGLLQQMSYLVAMPFQVAADVAGAKSYDPAEPAIVLLYLLAAVLLMRGAVADSPDGVGVSERDGGTRAVDVTGSGTPSHYPPVSQRRRPTT